MSDKMKLPKEEREIKRCLLDLVTTVERYLTHLDKEMKQPSALERGQRIADLSNKLELSKDLAKRFGLGITLSKKL